MSKAFVHWSDFHRHCDILSSKINCDYKEIDSIVALARGGLIPARIVAENIKYSSFYVLGLSLYDENDRQKSIEVYQDLPVSMNDRKHDTILIVDDISDGGTTFTYAYNKIKDLYPDSNIITAAPYIKPHTSFIPDYYTKEFQDTEWVVFPFEND
jgi:hypoxanthine phosphoribosyltransferase